MDAAYWLVPPSLLDLLSHTQDHLPRDGVTHSKLGPPTWIINQDNPTDLPTGRSDGSHFSVEAPSSQATGVRVKLTKTNQLTGEGAGLGL